MSYKWVKRIARGMLPCFVFFVFSFSFAPKAHAAAYTGKWNIGRIIFSPPDGNQTIAQTEEYTLPVTSSYYPQSGGTTIYYKSTADFYCFSPPSVTFTSPTKVYASYVPVDYNYSNTGLAGDNFQMTSNYMQKGSWSVSYINDRGETGQNVGGLDSFEEFTTTNSSASFGKGFALEAFFEGSEEHPIRSLMIKRANSSTTGIKNVNTTKTYGIVFQIPSFRVITTTYEADIEALDKVADEIAAQSDLLLAMKGDIVAILQDIYAMTGDIQIAQNLLNTYVSQMLPLLQHIDQTTTNIYSLLASQLRLLETAIENAADSVEAAIAAQTASMIAYLDTVLNTGNEVPDDTYQQTQDAENILNQLEQLEKPNVDTIVPVIDDYSNGDVSGVLNAIWGSNLIMTMMTVSVSLAFGAYVLFGKRS